MGASTDEPAGRGEWCRGRSRCVGHCSSLGLSAPQLKPILADIEYLQDQHLLLTVKSMDGYESYGERQGVPTAQKARQGPRGLVTCRSASSALQGSVWWHSSP